MLFQVLFSCGAFALGCATLSDSTGKERGQGLVSSMLLHQGCFPNRKLDLVCSFASCFWQSKQPDWGLQASSGSVVF